MSALPFAARSRCHGMRFVALWACLLCGCAKVEEMAKSATESAKEAVAAQTSKPASAPTSPAASATPAPSDPKVDSEKVLREFQALPSSQVGDEHLVRLAAMDSAHREQVLKLDLSESLITGGGLGTLASFPNLAELSLDKMSNFNPADLAPLKDLHHLRSVSFAGSSSINDSVVAYLAGHTDLEKLSLAACPVTEAVLKQISEFKSLKYLDFSGNPTVGAPGLAHLTSLPLLESLSLNGDLNIGEAGLLELIKCKGLIDLDLSYCGMTDKHFSILRNWTTLRSLNCSYNGLSDQGMEFFRPLTSLVALDLRHTNVSDLGLSKVASRKLERLWVTGITDQGMSLMKRHPALQELHVAECGITDAGILQLKGLKSLAVLDIARTQVTDRGLGELVGHKGLKRILLGGSAVTDAGVEALKQAIPGLVVADRVQ